MDSRISARALAAALGEWRSRTPVYEALADGIRLLCLDSRVAARTVLPAERELASALEVSRTTVAAAYRSLRESRHIESIRGSGSVTLPLRRHDPGTALLAGAIDLQQASPAAWPGLPAAMQAAAGQAFALVSRAGYDVVGDQELREAIAQRYTGRGIPTGADEILVTGGAQSAIHLIASVLLGRADRVLVESPTYPHAADAFRRAGARLVAVPVRTDEGWDLDRAEQAFARTLPVLAYLMPDFQNPTGRSMSAAERTVIAAAAERAGTLVVVDETTGELDIDRDHRPAPFRSDASVIRLGSLGKTVWGGLRIGWIRAAAPLIRRLAAARPSHDLGTPELEQAVAVQLVPQLDEIIRERSRTLRQGRDALVAALRRELPSWHVPQAHGGVSLWVGLGAPLSSALVMAARSRGLLLSAGSRFAAEGGHDGHLRVPFTAHPDTLERAVGILATAWNDVTERAPAPMREPWDAVV